MVEARLEERGQVALVRYSNPPDGFMNSAGANALLSHVKRAAADPTVRVIVLTGEADVFVRHYDVGELIHVAEALREGQITRHQFDHAPFVDLTDQIAAAPKPVIAAINGVALGGGFELALACDLRIAGRDVREIGLPETRLGIFPGAGGTQRLPHLIGEARAMDFILNGRIVDAQRAEQLGLVHALADDPVGAALDMALNLIRMPAAGLADAKRLIRGALDREMAPGLIAERRCFADLLKRDNAALDEMRRFVAGGARIGA